MVENNTGVELPIVLMGLPGAGKTTVGKLLAQQLMVPFVDTDEEISSKFRRTIPEIFEFVGEPGFRALEHQVLLDSLNKGDSVVSIGGGAPSYPPSAELLRHRTTVFLDVDAEVALQRLSGDDARPLLAEDPAAAWAELKEQRYPVYQELSMIRVNANQAPERVAGQIVATLLEKLPPVTDPNVTPVMVGGESNYPIWVGEDLSVQIFDAMSHAGSKVMIFYPGFIANHPLGIDWLTDFARRQGKEVFTFEVPTGENAKRIDVLEDCWEILGSARLGRDDLVVGVGGGATTDLAGFAAATWLRGIRVMHIPTTVLGMVDAAVGGKTGIDSPYGKNLIGSFHPPIGVFADLRYLQTLPKPELVSGLAEVIKAGYIMNPDILGLAQNYPEAMLDPASQQLLAALRCAVEVKAEVVSTDLKESGKREILNYGHTFGHAIERIENYSIRHGEAVAIGMVYAAHLGAILGVGSPDLPDEIAQTLSSVGLPTSYESNAWESLLDAMQSDKKARRGNIRFVLLEDIGQAIVLPVTDTDSLHQAAQRVGVK